MMALQRHEIVPGDESKIHDEPHLAGHRITVRTLAAAVEDWGLDPREVAERYDLPVADVYRALTYYHDHPEEMAEAERRRHEAEQEALARGVSTLAEDRERRDESAGDGGDG